MKPIPSANLLLARVIFSGFTASYATGVGVGLGSVWEGVVAFSVDGALGWLGVDSGRMGIGT